jgi:SERRATE/Ars2, N-terminal domain
LSKGIEISKDELQESFVKYRDDLLARTAKEFVKEHMSDTWFTEKYDPVLGPQTRNKLIGYRKWLYQKFMQDLDAGKFDELTLDGAAGKNIYMIWLD